MSKVFIKFHSNWAEEFDVNGFDVWDSRQEWDDYVASLTPGMFYREHYFGTNQAFEWSSKEEHLRSFTVIDISDEEVLDKLFGYDRGQFILVEGDGDDDEWED